MADFVSFLAYATEVNNYSRALLTGPGPPLGRLFRSLLTGWHWPEQLWGEGETGPIWVAESSLREFSDAFLCRSRSEQLLATPFGQRPLCELHVLVASDFFEERGQIRELHLCAALETSGIYSCSGCESSNSPPMILMF